jgi:hypothetical protein
MEEMAIRTVPPMTPPIIALMGGPVVACCAL